MAVPGTVEGDGEEAYGAPSVPIASGTSLKVVTRPAVVGPIWFDLFHPGTPPAPSPSARVRVVADVVGALTQIHGNSGLPREHRRHGRLTPRHVLVGVDGTASLFDAKQPFAKLLPGQPDLGYIAPELLTQSAPADQRSDVFSIGVMLWEALDNGRLFPHHRAAAISRLIARKGLPPPRVIEEWALPLVDVAQKALAAEPRDRYQSATELWLALREHLPAPDDAREELAQLAQSVLKLSLTADIRQKPPYLSGDAPLLSHTTLSDSQSYQPQLLETDTRYSMPVDHSSPPRSARKLVVSHAPRQTSLPPLDWGSLMPAPSSRPLASDYGRDSPVPSSRVSHAPAAARASMLPSSPRPSHAPRMSQRLAELEYRDRESASPRSSGYARGDASHPMELTYPGVDSEPQPGPDLLRHSGAPESEPVAQRGSPWLAIALVLVAFGGVGLGALVFGAGTAMGPKIGAEFHPAPVAAPAPVALESATAHSPVFAPAPVALESATAHSVAIGASTASDAPTTPPTEKAEMVDPAATTSASSSANRAATAGMERPSPHEVRGPAKRKKPPAAAAPSAAPAIEEAEPIDPAASAEPPSSVPEHLPFVTEPWPK